MGFEPHRPAWCITLWRKMAFRSSLKVLMNIEYFVFLFLSELKKGL
jgi:hypothetical protein